MTTWTERKMRRRAAYCVCPLCGLDGNFLRVIGYSGWWWCAAYQERFFFDERFDASADIAVGDSADKDLS